MHFLAVALLAILAGTLLLAKTKKEELGKFFTYISWFFLAVGFILFIGSIAGGICKISHCKSGQSGCRHEMMMKDCPAGMHDGNCCSTGMGNGSCETMHNCMKYDSTMKCCPGHSEADTSRMTGPETR